MMRSMVFGALEVCRVPKTRWPGLCGRQGELDRFQVAHFAHEDDVGILAERGLQRIGEGQRVNAELTLVHETFLCFMNELDRVFDGDDVAFEGVVQVIHHRGERCGLAGAGRTGHEDQALFLVAELADDWRAARASPSE